jgi:acyl carrier protein
MYDDQLIEQVRELMATTFDMDPAELPDDISQADCARWTSAYHLVLLVALEDQFGCTFSMEEMTSMTSLQHIVEVLQSRAVAAAAPAR